MADKKFWHNFATGETDYREPPTTDEEAEQYIPQMGGVGLYRIYREHGKLDILQAMIRVLEQAAQ
jgi:hypothetical protein